MDLIQCFRIISIILFIFAVAYGQQHTVKTTSNTKVTSVGKLTSNGPVSHTSTRKTVLTVTSSTPNAVGQITSPAKEQTTTQDLAKTSTHKQPSSHAAVKTTNKTPNHPIQHTTIHGLAKTSTHKTPISHATVKTTNTTPNHPIQHTTIHGLAKTSRGVKPTELKSVETTTKTQFSTRMDTSVESTNATSRLELSTASNTTHNPLSTNFSSHISTQKSVTKTHKPTSYTPKPQPVALTLIDILTDMLNTMADNHTYTYSLLHLSDNEKKVAFGIKQGLLTLGMYLPMIGSPITDLITVVKAHPAFMLQKVNFFGVIHTLGYKMLTFFSPFVLSRLDYFSKAANISQNCSTEMSFFVKSLVEGESWALKMVDAAGKPPTGILEGPLSWIGTPGECRAVEIKNDPFNSTPAYCNLFIEPPESLINMLTSGRPLPGGHQVQFDTCLPDVCTEEEIKTLINGAAEEFGFPVTSVHCQQTYGPLQHDAKAIVAMSVFSLILFLTLISTIYYYTRKIREHNKRNTIMMTSVNGGDKIDPKITDKDIETPDLHIYTPSDEPESLKDPVTTSVLDRILLIFSLPVNMRRTTSTKPNEHTLPCLHGIRVLSMGYIILGNTYYFLVNKNVLQNGVDMLSAIQEFASQPIINSTLAVDTFFLLGGTLVCYLFLLETRRRGSLSVSQVALFYLHRIWRVTPLYALIIMFYYCLSAYLLDGPIDVKDDPDRTNCGENWWTNLLYINNIYRSNSTCMAWTWYLSCDMQFFVVSPIVILSLFGFKYVGAAIVLLLILVQMIMTGYLEHKNGGNIVSPGSMSSDYFQEIFIKPYTRVAPYAIGLLLGYILHFKKKRKVNKWIVFLCWILCIDVLIMFPLISYTNNQGISTEWTKTGQAVHQAIFRPCWTLGVAWLIFACVNGYGGPVNSILSWKAWAPLSRVTFAAYLIHPILLSAQDYNIHTLVYYNTQTIVSTFAGTVTLTYGISFLASAVLEAPWRRMEEAILPGKLKREQTKS